MSPLYKSLLMRKHVNYVEIENHLFTSCNLKCPFCCQQHDSKPELTLELVDKRIEITKNFIDSKKGKYKNYVVNVMGGELLQDTLPDHYFELYVYLQSSIKDAYPELNFSFSLTTNLLFENYNRVLKLLTNSKLKLKLNASYDTVGRTWDIYQRHVLYPKNIELFKPYIQSISSVLHRPTIHSLIKKEDTYLTYLYNNFELDFSWYVPDKKLPHKFIPSDEDCKNILLYLKDKYPNSHPIKEYVNNPSNSITCCSENRILIDENLQYSNCQYLKYKQDSFLTPLDKDSTSGMFETFVKRQGCLTCPHFERCGLSCYVMNDFKDRERNEQCYIKEFFDTFILSK